MNLTPKQFAIAKHIVQYRDQKGIAPTLEEIAQALNVSKITVYEHVAQLERKGAVTKQKYQSRSVTVHPDLEDELRRRIEEDRLAEEESKTPGAAAKGSARTRTLPLMGTIAAGRPIEPVPDPQDLDLMELTCGDRANYVLKVRGNSMVDDGIRGGDYVLVENRSWASNGEVVVAVVPGNEATLKRFYKEGGRVRLKAASAEHQDILVDDCEIRGVVVGLVRRY